MRGEKTFFISGTLSLTAVWLANRFGLLGSVGFLEKLLSQEAAVGRIALLVVWAVLWVVFAAAARFFQLRIERVLLQQLGRIVGQIRVPMILGGLDRYLRSALSRVEGGDTTVMARAYNGSMIRQRLLLADARMADHNRSERLHFLAEGQAGVDAARSEGFYGLLRALVWAMPGLGFMGTALEMGGAVGGMGTSLTLTSDYQGLRNLLAEGVIPHLAGAFDVTLFALGGSVVCFLLLAIVHQREDEMLNAADEVSLAVLAKVADDEPNGPGETSPSSPDEQIEKLRTGLTVLGSELGKLNGFVERSSEALRVLFGAR